MRGSRYRVWATLLFLVSFLSSCSQHSPAQLSLSDSNKCQIVRLAFDIGSGSTKAKLAEVDRCKSKILRVLFEESRPVDYEAVYEGRGKLSSEIMKSGEASIEELLNLAASRTPENFQSSAVMTGTFRKAPNADLFRKRLKRRFGFAFKIVPTREEAKLGFLSAVESSNLPKESVYVWDVGGATMQFSGYEGKNFNFASLGFASVAMKNSIIKKVQKKNPNEISTPNPIAASQIAASKEIAAKKAQRFSRKLNPWYQARSKTVVGIGGVLRYSICGQTHCKDSLELSQIEKALKKRAGMTDTEIGGKYASTEISNLVLISAFMQTLGLSKIRVAKADLREGVLLDEDYWAK